MFAEIHRCYLVVEGPHDAAFVGKILSQHGIHRVKMLADLDPFWRRLVPTTFPHKDDLLARVPVPTFYTGEARSIAVHVATGDSRLVKTIEESLGILPSAPQSVGLVLDADSSAPDDRYTAVSNALKNEGLQAAPLGTASVGQVGVFVLPDNSNHGTLEDVLLQCAAINYPSLLQQATGFVTPILGDMPAAGLSSKEDQKFLKKRSGQSKAVISAMGSILRPGKAIQVSLEDNRWLEGGALRLPVVDAFVSFLRQLGAIA